MLYKLAVFAPLLGFIVAGLGGKRLGDRMSQWITCGFMGLAFVCGLYVFNNIALAGEELTLPLLRWIEIEAFTVDWGLKFDALSAVMIVVVTTVSFLVHVYSIGYMHGDKSVPRFMCYLSLFTFAMLMLVTAPNLVQLFFGWEGVGVASYLLIGFWYEKESANDASMKAFLVNRVGDIGLALGIAAIFLLFQSVEFESVFSNLARFATAQGLERPVLTFFGYSVDGLELAGILLFIGAMGKSAQFGLHTWLPDAMEGPTPVSALIHAATMVTAGVFLVVRMSPLYELAPFAREIICFVGAFTAFFAATIALTQTDIKRVIAYSTCSQLGYMFFAAGCSAYGAAIFHLFTHAFFKALLFLGAGSVIHAMSGEQDMRNMGGIAKMIPITHALMWIGSLALAGIPLFAGYYSKDLVIESAFASSLGTSQFAFIMGLVVAFLTAFYSWRVLLLTFYDKPRANESVMAHVHESGLVMLIPLFVLAVGAIFSGYFGYHLMFDNGGEFWGRSIFVLASNDVSEAIHHVPLWVKYSPLVLAVSGIGLAYYMYMLNKQLVEVLVERAQLLYKISFNKWFVDELYEGALIKPSLNLGNKFWQTGDGKIIDGFGPDGISALSLRISKSVGRLQTGYVYHYAFAVLLGLILMTTWYFFNEVWWRA